MSNLFEDDFMGGADMQAVAEAIKKSEEQELSVKKALQGTIDWHKQRLGKVTASRFNDVGFTADKETKAEGENGRPPTKENKLNWLIAQGQEKALQELADENSKGEISKLQIKHFEGLYDKTPGSIERGKLTGVAKSYMMELVSEITTGQWKEVRGKAIDWGNTYEPVGVQFYERLTGLSVQEAGFVPHPENNRIGGSSDGFVGEDGIIECKCPYNSAIHLKNMLTGEVPSEYMDQVQGNLMTTGRQWCDFFSFDPRVISDSGKMMVVRVYRDEAYISELYERLVRFTDIMQAMLEKVQGKDYSGYLKAKK